LRIDVPNLRIATRTILEDHPDHVLRHNNLIQPRDMRMYELTMVVDLAREVRVPLVGGLEDYLLKVSNWPKSCDCADVMRTLEPLVSLCDAR
jgi:hypothetical protein